VLAACGPGGGATGGTADGGAAAPAATAPAPDAPGGEQPITLSFTTSVYVEAPHRVAIDRLMEVYSSNNPHISFEVMGAGFEDFWGQLTIEILAGTEADIVQIYPEHIAQYHILRPGGTFVDLTAKVAATNFFEDLIGQEMCVFEGQTLAVSNYAWGSTGLFYRRSILEAKGIDPSTIRTHEDFERAALQLAGEGMQIMGVVLGTHPFVVDEWARIMARPVSFGLFFNQELAPFTPENVNINSPANIWAAQTWQDWIVQDFFNLVPDKRDSRELFWNGMVPFNFDGPWFIGMTRERDEALMDDLGLIPQFDLVFNGQRHVPNPSVFPLITLISTNAEHQDEAWNFMYWMASAEGQEIAAISGMTPASRSFAFSPAYRDAFPLGYQLMYFMENYYGPLINNPPLPEFGEIQRVMIETTQRIFSPAAADVETEMNEAHAEIQRILE
jgi:ABC-type glycerol-3-phosphate transport system substrate-binding protein